MRNRSSPLAVLLLMRSENGLTEFLIAKFPQAVAWRRRSPALVGLRHSKKAREAGQLTPRHEIQHLRVTVCQQHFWLCGVDKGNRR